MLLKDQLMGIILFLPRAKPVVWRGGVVLPNVIRSQPVWCSLEGLMLNLKLQYFGHMMQRADSFENTLMLGKLKEGEEGDDRR